MTKLAKSGQKMIQQGHYATEEVSICLSVGLAVCLSGILLPLCEFCPAVCLVSVLSHPL